ncbi:beta-1,3-galactosyltransferase 5 [Procambarus clarkii]|uniref:beta-1,3-galactosyltransferase 5 n=1 Tax=Procambarus clarkii TaxID=6728 RepID=UPI001E670571|nr:beta-1,3-galactosyltransferase 5-like [Procambarus clarkii]XP_045596093.1 beta-1,3-galactosyltransferase 5-like [Procambarus clarkii]
MAGFLKSSPRKFLVVALLAIWYVMVLYNGLLRLPRGGRGHTSRTGRVVRRPEAHGGWRQVLASWNPHYITQSRVEGEVVNPYPGQVRFKMSEEACREPPLVLAAVVTAVENRLRRQFVRRTWGHPSLAQDTGVKPLFVVGEVQDPKQQAMLIEESEQHHDMIQANFIDSYVNLSYKTTALLTWATRHCPNTPFILKIDDDVILNPIALREFLLAYLRYNPHPVNILGNVRHCDPVVRWGKWAMPVDIYPDHEYPSYVAGPSYLVPIAIVPTLLDAISRTRFLFLEDVYTTGLAAKRAGIGHYNIYSLTSYLAEDIDYRWSTGSAVFQENVDFNEAVRGWNILRKLEKIAAPPYNPQSTDPSSSNVLETKNKRHIDGDRISRPNG